MTTETIDTQEEVHNAVLVPATGPSEALIKFDVSAAAVAKMQKQANSLSITGPDDKTGYKLVYDTRQAIKDQRIAVQKKRDALKRPHIDYNREVDAAAAQLIDPMKAIEDKLAHQEKTYNDERDRIAREKALAERQRAEGRVNQLRAWGFQWNAVNEAYEAEFVVDDLPGANLSINFDDIKELSDEDYAPTYNLARVNYENYQTQLAEIQRQKEETERQQVEAKRIEQERVDAERKKLDEEKAELKRQQDELDAEKKRIQEEKDQLLLSVRVDRLLAAGFIKDGTKFNHLDITTIREGIILSFTDEQFDGVIQDAKNRTEAVEQARKEREADETLKAERLEKILAVGFELEEDQGLGVQTYVHGYLIVKSINLTSYSEDAFNGILQEADQITTQIKQAADVQKKADKERTDRLKSDKALLNKYLTLFDIKIPQPEQPEAVEFQKRIVERITNVVAELKLELEAL